jgi:hypothetical protein
LSIGGSYSQVEYRTDSAEIGSVFRGPGAAVELRYSIKPENMFSLGKQFIFTVFARYEKEFLKNIDRTYNEVNKKSGYGGGVDFQYSFGYLGFQYLWNTTVIISLLANMSTTFKNSSYGLRFGAIYDLTPSIAVTAGGTYVIGTAYTFDNPQLRSLQSISEWTGTIYLNIRLLTNSFFDGLLF